jgi:hypothetical protein
MTWRQRDVVCRFRASSKQCKESVDRFVRLSTVSVCFACGSSRDGSADSNNPNFKSKKKKKKKTRNSILPVLNFLSEYSGALRQDTICTDIQHNRFSSRLAFGFRVGAPHIPSTSQRAGQQIKLSAANCN